MPSFIKVLFLFIALVCFKATYAESYQYTINPGDVLEISVWKEDTLQRELRVLPDGTISFPLSGVINVEGKSIKAVQTELTKKLTEYINDPVVNIIVKSVEGNTVYVLGQVKTPGRFIMYQPLDVMQALTLAGGLTPFAKANNIVILRRNKASSEAIKFEYSDLEEGKWLYKNHVLKTGDVIVVP
jgi:polysaccharide export outer membrane protein